MAQPVRMEIRGEDVVRFLRRYVLVILGVFVLTVAGTYTVLSLMTELYEAEAALLVKIGRENLDPSAASRNLPLTSGVRREDLPSEISILHAPELVAKVVDSIGPEAFRPKPVVPVGFIGHTKYYVKQAARGIKKQYQEALYALDLAKRLDDRQTAIQGILDNLVAEPVKDSDVIAIRLRYADPLLAQRVEARLIQEYMALRTEIRGAPGVEKYFDVKAEVLQKDLLKAEAEKASWKDRFNLVSAGEQKSLMVKAVRELLSHLNATRSEIASLESQLKLSENVLASMPVYVKGSQQETPNPTLESLKQQVASRETERARLLSKFKEDSETVTTLDREIERFRTLLEKEAKTQIGSVTSQLNPSRQIIEQQLDQNRIRLVGLKVLERKDEEQLNAISREVKSLDAADMRLGDIERNRTLAEQDYFAVMKRKTDSVISNELDNHRISNISIVMEPSIRPQPVYPRKLLIMMISLGAGLLLGLGIALLLNHFDDSATTAAQIELATGVPCLGEVG
ncbi:MAG: hypothetical protein IPP47_07390 [Bryobacterales bacterium]|nr:hypothetical protein [Bryobacterales bacterium]